MKARNLAVLATVAVGAMALSAPAAFAADAQSSTSKAQERTNKDIKRLGENVRDLRKKDDEINGRIDSIVAGLSPVLTQLGDAAKSYANFQYGFVQLTFQGAGGPQTFFAVTPRLDPTSQQSTVTSQFVIPAALNNLKLGAEVGVRSLNSPASQDEKSTPYCRITASQGATRFGTSAPNTSLPTGKQLPFYPVYRSTLEPKDPVDAVGSLVGAVTGDKTVNLLGTTNSVGSNGGTGDFSPLRTDTGGDVLQVTLACMAIDNDQLKKAGITPGVPG